MRRRIWPVLVISFLLFVITSVARAQPVGPDRSLPQPAFPLRNGGVPAPKQDGEEFRGPRGSVSSMKVVVPNMGWAMSIGRLMWTSNGGGEWKDITPPNPNDGIVADIFFLDANHGWVILAYGEPDSPGGLHLDLAITDDSGASWLVKPCGSNSGVESLTFLDPSRGWLALYGGRNSMSSGYGTVEATSDGGKSWAEVPPDLPHQRPRDTDESPSGPMVMITAQFGWMVAGGDRLYVTRDGAETWQRVNLEPPIKTDLMKKYDQNLDQLRQRFQALPPAAAKLAKEWEQKQDDSDAAYDLPIFEDPKHGYIAVAYPGVAVLFVTEDGGVTWKPDRILSGLAEASQGLPVYSAVVDSTWIVARIPRGGRLPQLSKLGPGASVTDTTMPAPEESGISRMSFATASQGWVVTVDGKLLSTNDAGATWTDITPNLPPR